MLPSPGSITLTMEQPKNPDEVFGPEIIDALPANCVLNLSIGISKRS